MASSSPMPPSRAELGVPGLAAVSGTTAAELEPRLRALVGASCSSTTWSPVPRAWPVRLRPGPHPGGRVQHALEARPQGSPPGSGALLREPRHGRARWRVGRALPRGARWPRPARPTRSRRKLGSRSGERRTSVRARRTSRPSPSSSSHWRSSSDPAEWARLDAAVEMAARQGLDAALVVRHAEAAVLERRRTGDREAIALAIAEHARVVRKRSAIRRRLSRPWTQHGRSSRTLSTLSAGVELMSAIASAHSGRNPRRPCSAGGGPSGTFPSLSSSGS